MSDTELAKTIHDINAAISALSNAIELTKDEWRTNPELVDRILPLTVDKIHELKDHLAKYKNLNLD
jgi:hypothetical protein